MRTSGTLVTKRICNCIPTTVGNCTPAHGSSSLRRTARYCIQRNRLLFYASVSPRLARTVVAVLEAARSSRLRWLVPETTTRVPCCCRLRRRRIFASACFDVWSSSVYAAYWFSLPAPTPPPCSLVRMPAVPSAVKASPPRTLSFASFFSMQAPEFRAGWNVGPDLSGGRHVVHCCCLGDAPLRSFLPSKFLVCVFFFFFFSACLP